MAIALATEIKADLVIIDEQEGRQLAAQSGLSVIGVLRILLRAKRNGHIPAIKPENSDPARKSALLHCSRS